MRRKKGQDVKTLKIWGLTRTVTNEEQLKCVFCDKPPVWKIWLQPQPHYSFQLNEPILVCDYHRPI